MSSLPAAHPCVSWVCSDLTASLGNNNSLYVCRLCFPSMVGDKQSWRKEPDRNRRTHISETVCLDLSSEDQSSIIVRSSRDRMQTVQCMKETGEALKE